jgi:hypothetical protein
MKKKYAILIGLGLLLILIRLLLPCFVLWYANKALSKMTGYYGHIEDIDLSLHRAAYSIKNMYFNKIDPVSKNQTLFFRVQKIDGSLEWSSLFKGALVGKLAFYSPEFIFTKDKMELADVKKSTPDFRVTLKKLMPLTVNRIEVFEGAVHYTDNSTSPKVDVEMNNAHILAYNLSNVENISAELPSRVSAQASVNEGVFHFEMKLNALSAQPTFDLNAEFINVNLVKLNDFLKAYGNFDVSSGTFALYAEMAAKDGKFIGYVKPMITDLKVIGKDDRKDSFFNKIWEAIVGTAGVVFENQSKDQLATKIRIEGKYANPRINTLDAVWEFLRNAFVQALLPIVDNELTLGSVNAVKPAE